MKALSLVFAIGFFFLPGLGIGIGVAGQSEPTSWAALGLIIGGLVSALSAHLATKAYLRARRE